MANRQWVLLIVGALAIGICQNCGGADRKAAEATKQAEEAAAAQRQAAEQAAMAAAAEEAARTAEREAAEREAASLAAAEAARQHTVVAGDCLWYIARDRWSDGRRWPEIHAANTALIKDPDLIYPGQVLSIPPG